MSEAFDIGGLILGAMFLPLIAAVVNLVHRKDSDANDRDMFTFLTAIATFVAVIFIWLSVGSGTSETAVLFTFVPGLDFAFNVEPLGLLFALIASGLWIPTHVYAIGYMRGNNEDNHPRFFACFAIAISAVMGIAFSANLFTLFVFYEILTLSTYPFGGA